MKRNDVILRTTTAVVTPIIVLFSVQLFLQDIIIRAAVLLAD